jgi:hypothetical protein
MSILTQFEAQRAGREEARHKNLDAGLHGVSASQPKSL